jgi:hypothetical protein
MRPEPTNNDPAREWQIMKRYSLKVEFELSVPTELQPSFEIPANTCFQDQETGTP